MGLQETISAGVATAFRAVADLVVVMPLSAPGSFDAVTETETPGTTGTIKAIQLSQADAERYFAGFNWRGIAGETQASDVVLMAEAASATLVPQEGQKATWAGAVYQLHRIDSSNPALLMLQLRRPK